MIISGCKYDKFNDSLSHFKELNDVGENSKIYIIPGSGCTDSISSAEELALKNINSDSHYFIFTEIRSLKIFKNKFPQLYIAKNVIVDSLNYFKYPNDQYRIYPIVYKMVSKNLEFFQYLKP